MILCRSDKEISGGIKDKISLFCDVDKEAVIPLVTSETIYEVPLLLEDAGLGEFIVRRLGLRSEKSNLEEWRAMVNRLKTPKEPVIIGLVGKYVGLRDAYYSVREALCHAGTYLKKADAEIDSDLLSTVQFGEVSRSGNALMLFDASKKGNTLVLAADTSEDVISLLDMMGYDGLSACLTSDHVAVCSVGYDTYYDDTAVDETSTETTDGETEPAPEVSPTPSG